MAFTKRLTVIWNGVTEPNAEWQVAKEQYLIECIQEGITDGVWSGDFQTSSRVFTDQAAAERFLARWIEIAVRFEQVPVSTSITDI